MGLTIPACYRMDMLSGEEIARQDPFGGEGVFLPCDAGGADEILGSVTALFGEVPAVAWPGSGAWVKLAGPGLSEAEARSLWDSR